MSAGPVRPQRAGWLSAAAPGHWENWRAMAACRFVDPELFFPVSASGKCLEQIAEAKAVCGRCLARPECLAFAQRTGQPHGIWGGLTEEERVRAPRGPQRGPATSPRAGGLRVAWN